MLPFQAAAAAAYVHIPFCARKCSYCDFISYPGVQTDLQQAYVNALLREIRLTAHIMNSRPAACLQPLETVFLGGGTPTLLPPAALSDILESLHRSFGMTDTCEVTLEANPGTVTRQSLQQYRQAGFNRISFGLQAIKPELLQVLGRIHTADDFSLCAGWAADAGFKSISVDLMTGLPGQTVADVSSAVRFVLQHPVQHLSFYTLTLEEGTPLMARCRQGGVSLPSDEEERSQYHCIRSILAQAGWDHYEISNAALPGQRCRHNLTYWQARPYYGFGVAAHRYLNGKRLANTSSLDVYLTALTEQAVSDRHDPAWLIGQISRELEDITPAEAMKEMMLLGLRLMEGVHDHDFKARFDCSLYDHFAEQVRRLTASGLLTADDSSIRLTERGLDLANLVFQAFI